MPTESKSQQKECFNLLELPDLHLGHRSVNIDIAISRIREFVYPYLKTIDILHLPGDVFDTLFTLSSNIVVPIMLFMRELIELSITYNFYIRIVRGTYDHDRNQNNLWKGLSDLSTDRVRIFDTITIENLLGMNFLYIPDGLPKGSIFTIKELLKDNLINKVDWVIGHGQMEHNIPNGAVIHGNIFSVDDFKDIVVGGIVFGHIHTFSVYKNFISPGSFDRLRHGEESPKGFVIINYNKETHKVTYEFIENTKATTFKTINLTKISNLESAVHYYKKKLNKLIFNRLDIFYIRVIVEDSILRDTIKNITNDLYSNIILTFKKEKDLEIKDVSIDDNFISDLPIITDENLSSLIYTYIDGSLSMDEIEEILKELKHGHN